jgi:hypothetical protein
MTIDFTIHLPRILGHAPSVSIVPAPRAPGEPQFYWQRVPGGLEVRIGSHLLYAESASERP